MIEIIDSQIIRDGVNIGSIVDGTAYVTEKQAPRIVGQIRAAAGNADLVFVLGEAPTVKESLPVAEPEEIGVTVEVPDIETQPEPIIERKAKTPEPARNPALGDKDPAWQAWYVSEHGAAAFQARWPGRPLP
jgi:hypothetical protein